MDYHISNIENESFNVCIISKWDKCLLKSHFYHIKLILMSNFFVLIIIVLFIWLIKVMWWCKLMCFFMKLQERKKKKNNNNDARDKNETFFYYFYFCIWASLTQNHVQYLYCTVHMVHAWKLKKRKGNVSNIWAHKHTHRTIMQQHSRNKWNMKE